jgi:copper chaperone
MALGLTEVVPAPGDHHRRRNMSEAVLRIEGMSCQHCVIRVKKAVGVIPGVFDSEVGVGTARITYDEMRIRKADLGKAVEEAGYKVIG